MNTLLLQENVADEKHPFWGLFLLFLLIALYFLPTIVGRKKPNFMAIALLNTFLGWTFVGWVVALVWAVSNNAPVQQIIVQTSAAPPAPPIPAVTVSVSDELEKLARLRDSGALTETEFQAHKMRLLDRS